MHTAGSEHAHVEHGENILIMLAGVDLLGLRLKQ